MMNVFCGVGNLVSDPILYEGDPSRAVFVLAIDHDGKPVDGKKNAEYLDFVAWRNNAEYIAKYCHKGDLLSVVGTVKKHEYSNADGDKVSKVEIHVSSVNSCNKAKVKE